MVTAVVAVGVGEGAALPRFDAYDVFFGWRFFLSSLSFFTKEEMNTHKIQQATPK